MTTKPIFKTISDCFLETSQIKDFSEEDFQNLYKFLEHRNIFNDIWSIINQPSSYSRFKESLKYTNPNIKDKIYSKLLKDADLSSINEDYKLEYFYSFCKDAKFFRIELIQKCLNEISLLYVRKDHPCRLDMIEFVSREQEKQKISMLEKHHELISKIDLFLEQQQNKPKNRII